jgi:hypothetical protein
LQALVALACVVSGWSGHVGGVLFGFSWHLRRILNDTGRWRDSQLIGGWIADLATDLHQRSNAALDDAQYGDWTPT